MTNFITRRTLLRFGAGSLGILGMGSRLGRLGLLNAQVVNPTPNYKAMVCIFLFGGNDSNNAVIPMQTKIQNFSTYLGIRGSGLGLSPGTLAQFAASNGD